eukprot:g10017.t1
METWKHGATGLQIAHFSGGPSASAVQHSDVVGFSAPVRHNSVLQRLLAALPSIRLQDGLSGEARRGRVLVPFIGANGDPSILEYARSHAGRFMHILPSGLWRVIAPLKLSQTFRARHRTAQRRRGRLFMFMSASISLGVLPLIVDEPACFVARYS